MGILVFEYSFVTSIEYFFWYHNESVKLLCQVITIEK